MNNNTFFSKLQNWLLLIVVWAVCLLAASYWASLLVPYQPSFPYFELLIDSELPRWLYSWGNFDGVHYLTIVGGGYFYIRNVQAFFPVYPTLAWLVAQLTQYHFLALWITNLISFVALAAGWRYLTIKVIRKPPLGWWSWVALLSFPTSFFFLGTYSESLFLALVVWSLSLARSKKWILAILLAGIASGTRIVGIALVPALILEAWIQFGSSDRRFQKNIKNWQKGWGYFKNRLNWPNIKLELTQTFSIKMSFISKKWKLITGIILGASSGLLIYMTFLWIRFNDPLFFYHVQSEFGAGREESLVFLPQVIWRYLNILATVRPFDWKYYAYSQEFFLSLTSLAILLFSLKKVRTSYVLFSLIAWTIPTLTGTFSSMPRYILVCFPIFIVLGGWLEKHPRLRWVLPLSLAWLTINTMLFIQGWWVA